MRANSSPPSATSAQSGIAILWIEHVVHALLAVVDRLVVLNFGRKIAEGDRRKR